MQPKFHQQKRAHDLRVKGHSISDIARRLGVSKSSVSLWTHNISLSSEAQMRIFSLQARARENAYATLSRKRTERERKAYLISKDIISRARINTEGAIILCAMIYWCEGNKNAGDGVIFTNSDKRMIKLFLDLLRLAFKVDEKRFRVCMHLHAYHNEGIQLKFWSKITKIPQGQFIKTFQKEHTGKQTRPGYQGCIQIRYRDASLARILLAVGEIFMANKSGLYKNPI